MAPRGPETYLITGAQACGDVNQRLLDSMDVFTAERAGRMVVLPMLGMNSNEDRTMIDPLFGNRDVEWADRPLNRKVRIMKMEVPPQVMDPFASLDRHVQHGRSEIIASGKQSIRPVPDSQRDFPKFLLSTGAVTFPRYATGEFAAGERRRRGRIAELDHKMGGLVVEVANQSVFYFRHVTSDGTGTFYDLGRRYTPEGVVEDQRPEALVLGDYHCGRTDPDILQATYTMIDELKPRRIVLHDFFDGHSVSHHIVRQPIQQDLIHRQDENQTSLEEELSRCLDELLVLSDMTDEVALVASNHHEFLNRYLEEGRYVDDMENFRIAAKLLDYYAAADENDPVEYGIKLIARARGIEFPDNIIFLKRTSDYKVEGYQLAAHGDRGAAGGYGSITGKEKAYGRSVTGHVHKAQAYRNTHTVGTMLLPADAYYTRGNPIDWSNSHLAIYPGSGSTRGAVQHLIFHSGYYHLGQEGQPGKPKRPRSRSTSADEHLRHSPKYTLEKEMKKRAKRQ